MAVANLPGTGVYTGMIICYEHWEKGENFLPL